MCDFGKTCLWQRTLLQNRFPLFWIPVPAYSQHGRREVRGAVFGASSPNYFENVAVFTIRFFETAQGQVLRRLRIG